MLCSHIKNCIIHLGFEVMLCSIEEYDVYCLNVDLVRQGPPDHPSADCVSSSALCRAVME